VSAHDEPVAVRLDGVGRSYPVYEHQRDRLLEVLTKHPRHRLINALHPTDLIVPRGQVLGIVGNNGAGKSTLLKLIAGTLTPSVGRVEVNGSVSALLELGGGFHPDMSGRENVFLKGAIMGMDAAVMRTKYAEIVEFAGIADFMDQPVKTYSSGMFMRLAFALATCVEPDVLLVDEALSVGDGAFARKSFDRIMQFKRSGHTILFCSHSLYQVEAMCDRVVWIDQGAVRKQGNPAEVIADYTSFMNTETIERRPAVYESARGTLTSNDENSSGVHQDIVVTSPPSVVSGTARLQSVTVMVDGVSGRRLPVISKSSDLTVMVEFLATPDRPPPSIAVALKQMDGRIVCSAGTLNDGLTLHCDASGQGRVSIEFPQIALLKGVYGVDVYLLCEQAIHCYEEATLVAELNVTQKGLEMGVVSLPRHWQIDTASSEARLTEPQVDPA
jgi:lipopolysaccharide transport system ATP-binding protein